MPHPFRATSLPCRAEHFTTQRPRSEALNSAAFAAATWARVLAQDINDLLIFSSEIAHGVEYRQVGLAGAVLFETLSAADSYVSIESKEARRVNERSCRCWRLW